MANDRLRKRQIPSEQGRAAAAPRGAVRAWRSPFLMHSLQTCCKNAPGDYHGAAPFCKRRPRLTGRYAAPARGAARRLSALDTMHPDRGRGGAFPAPRRPV